MVFVGGRPIRKKTYSHSYNEIFEASLKAVKQMGWTIISEDRRAGEIKARTGISLRSWGEDVLISISKVAAGTTISVSSGASFQLFDWGKSWENEEVFLKELEKIISR